MPQISDYCSFFSEAEIFLCFSSNSIFNGRNTGGKSGAMLILPVWFLRNFAFCSQLFRCCKSLNRIMRPAFSLFARRWHEEKSNTEASVIFRCCLAIRSSSTIAMELCLICTKPSIGSTRYYIYWNSLIQYIHPSFMKVVYLLSWKTKTFDRLSTAYIFQFADMI